MIILDINKETGEKTQEELQTKYGPGSAKFIACDISKKEELTSKCLSKLTFMRIFEILESMALVCKSGNSFNNSFFR